MEISSTLVLDDGNDLVHNIVKYYKDSDTIVPVRIQLPEYLDATSLLAMEKRLLEVSHATGKRIRLLARTTNTDVEKMIHRMFAESDSVYVTIDWRESSD